MSVSLEVDECIRAQLFLLKHVIFTFSPKIELAKKKKGKSVITAQILIKGTYFGLYVLYIIYLLQSERKGII